MSPVAPRKSLGQHFLVDQNIARKIVDALRAAPQDPVVEIGPGIGALSAMLVEKYSEFTAIEIDARAVEQLRMQVPGIVVRHMDVLDIDWSDLRAEMGRPLHVIGNLPYNISSPILFGLFASARSIAEAVVMLQLEVAERIVAVPRTKQYGILGVAAQLVCEPELLFRVSRNVFRPRPAVTSAVVRLRFNGSDGDSRYEGSLQRVIRMAFNQRRKKLRNSLRRFADERGIDVPEPWASRRAEELSPEEFVALTNYLTR
ncbi:MAG: 16S rRNA (adenine(1518)-N(6)/adenine(1519)-N(6))-dimethyltransferase RsmA [Rhodothermales bacterium]|nr:16S rRNA (adenine(1518)-N(6)/adenine(1519)-N(6))-dimethyltransferase RsmA [Rhodothermales bacterium]